MDKIPSILEIFLGLLIFWLILLIVCWVGYLVEIIDNRQRKAVRQLRAAEDMLVVISDPAPAEVYV